MEQWERDINDLKDVLKCLTIVKPLSSLSRKELLVKFSEAITEARLKVLQWYTSYSHSGSNTESKQSSAPQERK